MCRSIHPTCPLVEVNDTSRRSHLLSSFGRRYIVLFGWSSNDLRFVAGFLTAARRNFDCVFSTARRLTIWSCHVDIQVVLAVDDEDTYVSSAIGHSMKEENNLWTLLPRESLRTLKPDSRQRCIQHTALNYFSSYRSSLFLPMYH